MMTKLSGREKRCRKKKVYKTPLDAIFAKQRLWKHNKEVAHPYICSECGKIHLTTEDSPQKRAREANKVKQFQKPKARIKPKLLEDIMAEKNSTISYPMGGAGCHPYGFRTKGFIENSETLQLRRSL